MQEECKGPGDSSPNSPQAEPNMPLNDGRSMTSPLRPTLKFARTCAGTHDE